MYQEVVIGNSQSKLDPLFISLSYVYSIANWLVSLSLTQWLWSDFFRRFDPVTGELSSLINTFSVGQVFAI